jgi:imidazolonepropionase-like amidohydrolase
MKLHSLLVAFILLAFIPQTNAQVDASALALTHVTVIDATGAPPKPDMTVLIIDRRIREIGKSSSTHSPHGTKIIDANGKFLIPGLWDMHVHWSDTDYLPLFLATGITGMRIMWGDPVHHEWRKLSEAGKLLAPHLVIASELIDGPKPFWPSSISVSTVAQARAAVDQAKQNGADFVKVYSFLPREEYFAIVDEAKKQNIPFAGHLPLAVSAEEASNAGQKSFEHLFGMLPAFSSHSEEFLQAYRDDLADALAGGHPTFWGAHYKALRQMELDSYSPERAATLFNTFKRNGTFQVPTLTLLRSIAYVDDHTFTSDPRLKYVPPRMREEWNAADATYDFGPRSPEDGIFFKKEFQKELELVVAMQQAGVGILAGTDTSNPYCIPGFSLHDELGLMVKAGLTPMQALQTATINPARFLGGEKDSGTIETGKVADLVLLDANPLDDIANTQKINAVIYGGKLFPRTEIDRMLAQVEALATRQPIGDALMKTIRDKDIAAAVAQYHDLKTTQPNAYDFSAQELIGLGYVLLRMKKIPEAIEIFKLSIEAGPRYYNTWDSLADAYLEHGDKNLAIQNYKKARELNPQDKNAIEKLKQLNTR